MDIAKLTASDSKPNRARNAAHIRTTSVTTRWRDLARSARQRRTDNFDTTDRGFDKTRVQTGRPPLGRPAKAAARYRPSLWRRAMKTGKSDQYYCAMMRGAVVLAVLAGGTAYGTSTDVIPRWIVLTDASRAQPGDSTPLLLVQNDGAATGAEAGTATAADDAASVFAPAGCGGLGGPGCGRLGGGSGNGSGHGGAAVRMVVASVVASVAGSAEALAEASAAVTEARVAAAAAVATVAGTGTRRRPLPRVGAPAPYPPATCPGILSAIRWQRR
ncbi:hypothetical protein [Paraburkholderia sp. 40]|uniref:hypothetical protein n=1 Tax=Paraburkholderia sp. 40 TaxID=2991059 RepID=UPI003D23B00C